MRHELGHDMVAKGEVAVSKVIERLKKLVGEENVDAVLEHYAAAYSKTGLNEAEIWEEIVCDSLGDMNIFAGDKVISEFMAPVLKDIKQGVSETKGEANKTRGAPEGKASREIPKRDKALYASGVYFLHKNFPPENERLSEAHRLATWWARGSEIEAGDQTLIFMNDVCYLVECFDDALNQYQVEDVVSKQDFDYYYEGIKKNGKVGQIKSILAATNGYDSDYKQYHTADKGKSGINRYEIEHRRESEDVVRLDSNKTAGREQSSSDGSRDSQSGSENKQKYSRELDSLGNELSNEQQDYFKDTKVRDENGDLLVVYHGSPRGRTTVFDRNKTSRINDMGQGHYFSSNAENASTYMGETKGRKLYEAYLNITAPFVVSDDVKISLEEAKSLLKLSENKYAANDVYYYLAREAKDGYVTTSQLANTNISQEMTDILIKSGKYDGIIDETVADKWGLEKGTKHYVALEANQIKSTTNKNPTKNADIRFSRELDLIDYINEQAGKESDDSLTKTQKVAQVRGELERMNVDKGSLMALTKVGDKLFDLYGGESSISEFRYGMLEATKLAQYKNKTYLNVKSTGIKSRAFAMLFYQKLNFFLAT